MSYFPREKPPEYIVESLRRCPACDWSEFGVKQVKDLVHCEACGSLYYINPDDVGHPVAKVTLKEQD